MTRRHANPQKNNLNMTSHTIWRVTLCECRSSRVDRELDQAMSLATHTTWRHKQYVVTHNMSYRQLCCHEQHVILCLVSCLTRRAAASSRPAAAWRLAATERRVWVRSSNVTCNTYNMTSHTIWRHTQYDVTHNMASCLTTRRLSDTISRLLKIIGLFCKRALQKTLYSAAAEICELGESRCVSVTLVV